MENVTTSEPVLGAQTYISTMYKEELSDSTSKLLAISQISGTTLFVKKFDEEIKYGGQLLGIGINAIRVFLLDSFKRTNITTIQVDELTVMMANIDDVIIYYVYTGDRFEHEYRFTRFLERLVTLECWDRLSQSEYNVYKKDAKSISLVVEEIFAYE
ncbi:MAG: hypothetical protein ACC656_04925 [Candidatus Heimdallarchaeota archaeon]